MLGKTTHMNIQSTLLPLSFQKIDDCLKFKGLFKIEDLKIQFLKFGNQKTLTSWKQHLFCHGLTPVSDFYDWRFEETIQTLKIHDKVFEFVIYVH